MALRDVDQTHGATASATVPGLGSSMPGLAGSSVLVTGGGTGIGRAVGLARTLAAEWGSSGIRVNAVAPGFVRTPMTDLAIDRGVLDLDAIERRTPLGRRAEPSEMVGPVLFLLSDAASYVNGACLVAD